MVLYTKNENVAVKHWGVIFLPDANFGNINSQKTK